MRLNSGGRFDPVSETWSPISTVNAPSPRFYHDGVWTGTEMIVWGGYDGSGLDTGGRYDPATDSWEILDAGASRAFAVCDHQVAHVYASTPEARRHAAHVIRNVEGVGQLLDRANQALQTIERYKARLDDAISSLTALEIEDEQMRANAGSPENQG